MIACPIKVQQLSTYGKPVTALRQQHPDPPPPKKKHTHTPPSFTCAFTPHTPNTHTHTHTHTHPTCCPLPMPAPPPPNHQPAYSLCHICCICLPTGERLSAAHLTPALLP
jgi:hypothetical protein